MRGFGSRRWLRYLRCACVVRGHCGPEQSSPSPTCRQRCAPSLDSLRTKENQANAFPMSSPPSVPNSYWGSDTFRKDSVGCSSSLKAPDRPRYEAAGPAPGNVLWCSDGCRYSALTH